MKYLLVCRINCTLCTGTGLEETGVQSYFLMHKILLVLFYYRELFLFNGDIAYHIYMFRSYRIYVRIYVQITMAGL